MLKVRDISKKFGDKTVLDRVNLDIEEASIFGLIGPNGAGKTTLINIICGLIDSDNGTVEIGGFDIKKNPIDAKRILGLVPQELALIETMSIVDNLEYFGAFYNLSSAELKSRTNELLETVGLTDKRKEKISKFSGGMKRRGNLAVALMHKPKFLILDEPTVGVDPQSRNKIFEYLKELNKNGVTILYTSHYMEEVEALCDKIFIIDEGREVAYGTKEQIKSMVSISSEYSIELKETSNELVSKLSLIEGVLDIKKDKNIVNLTIEKENFKLNKAILAIEESSGEILSLKPIEPSLNDVFLSLTGKNLRE